MTDSDHRNVQRDSLFLLADIEADGGINTRVRVRNLSSGGMMADSEVQLERGTPVKVSLRNIGVVTGYIAWSRAGRFGIAFDHAIDARMARQPGATSDDARIPRYVRPILPVSAHRALLRKA